MHIASAGHNARYLGTANQSRKAQKVTVGILEERFVNKGHLLLLLILLLTRGNRC